MFLRPADSGVIGGEFGVEDESLDQLLGKGSVVETQDGKGVFDLLGLIEGLDIVDEKNAKLGWVILSAVLVSRCIHVLLNIEVVEELYVLAYGHSACSLAGEEN